METRRVAWIAGIAALTATLIAGGGDGGIADAADGNPRPVSSGAPVYLGPHGAAWKFSADGRYALLGVPGTPRRVDLTSGDASTVPISIASGYRGDYPVAFSADGESLLVSSEAGLTADDDGTAASTSDLFRWSFATGAWSLLTPGPSPWQYFRVRAISDDGRIALVTRAITEFGPAELYRYDLATNIADRVDTTGASSLPTPSLSADGSVVAYTEASQAWVYRSTDHTRTPLDADLPGLSAAATSSSPFLSANGRYVSFMVVDGSLRTSYVRDLQTAAAWPAASDPGTVSDDGQRVAYAGPGPSGSAARERFAYVYDHRHGDGAVTELIGTLDHDPTESRSVISRDGRSALVTIRTDLYRVPLRASSLAPIPAPGVPPASLGTIAGGPAELVVANHWLGAMTDDGRFVWAHEGGGLGHLLDRQNGFIEIEALSGTAVLHGVPGGLLVSTPTSLDPADTDGVADVYRYDLASHTFSLLTGDLPADRGWSLADASLDGSRLLLTSVPEWELRFHTYVFTPATGSLVEVGLDVPGAVIDINTGPRAPSMSEDGRYIAYVYVSGPGGCLRCAHAWLYDTVQRSYTAVDRSLDGSPAWGDASDVEVAGDGSAVVFRSNAYDLATDAPPTAGPGIYHFDVATGTITRVHPSGTSPSISGDGRRIAYVDGEQFWVYDRTSPAAPVRQQMSDAGGVAPDSAIRGAITIDGDEVLFQALPFLSPNDPYQHAIYRRPLLDRDTPPPTTTTTSTSSTTTTSTAPPPTSTVPSVPPPTGVPPTTTPRPPVVGGPSPTEPGFRPLLPARVLDTRSGGATADGQFAGGGALAPGETLRLRLAGRGGVDTAARTVALNLTATDAATSGYLTVWPCAGAAPNASNLNVVAGATVANLVVTGLDADGFACIRAGDTRVHLIADVAASSAVYEPLVPARLLDQRPGGVTVDGVGAGAGAVGPGDTVTLRVAGRGGVPSQPGAVALNVTATDPAGGGYVTVWPCGPAPNASSVNVAAGAIAANLVVVPTDADGDVCLRTMETSASLIVDVQGYVPRGAGVVPHDPARLLDTRPGGTTADGMAAGTGPVAPGTTLELPVAGRLGVPDDAVAVIVNVTATDPDGAGYVTVWPCGPAPNASTLNVAAGATVANAAIVGLDDTGSICLRPSESTMHLLVDIAGHVS